MKTLVTCTLATLLLITSFFACKKDEPKKKPDPVPTLSKLNVIYASPSAEKLDFYIDGKKNNTDDLSYTNKIGYLSVESGSKKIDINKKGQTVNLLTQTFSLLKDISNSLFIIDKFADIKFLLIKDEYSAPAAGKAQIRFVHLSPDAPALNLEIAGKTPELVTNKAFKEYSGFVTIDPAEKVTFNVKNKETGAIETVAADVKIEAGKTYTIWIKGLKANATGDLALGTAIYTH